MSRYIILKKILVFVIIFIFILSYLFTIKNIFKGNEIDVLPVAKQFMNKKWLSSDWYLNLIHSYRMLFNIFAGSMALFMPLWIVALVGRFIIGLIFSYLIYKICEFFSIKIILTLFFLYIWLTYFNSLGAKEWILKGFEAKSFSYISALFSLYYLYKKNYLKVTLLSGLAISFHVLVGIYSFFCLIVTTIFNYKYLGINFNPRNFIRHFFIFIFSSFFGIFSIVDNIFGNAIDINDIKLAGLIYATFRVPHHVMPSHWENNNWIFMFILIILFYIFLFFYNDQKLKLLAFYVLSSASIFLIGLFIFIFKKYDLLKYYFFRHADVIMPFFFIFTLAYLLQRIINYISYNVSKVIKKCFFICNLLLVILFVFISMKNLTYFIKVRLDKKDLMLYSIQNVKLEECLKYIKDNTEKDAILLVYPGIENIYIAANRAVFVSIKHCPQKEKDIIEWYNRLKLCNDDISIKKISDVILNIEERFYNLRIETIEKIKNKYKIDYYLGKPNKNYPYKIIYQNSDYAIYKIK